MRRLFQDHIIRYVQDLCGIWDFSTDPQDIGIHDKWFNGLPTSHPVSVPSVWNTELGLLLYEGAGWYQKKFYTQGGCLRFCFDAVLTQADVWLDDIHLGQHYGGFCQFSFIENDVAPGFHTLTVRADNRFDAYSIPMAKVDWYHYGGISRNVTVETLNGICALHNQFHYTLNETLDRSVCRLDVELYNASKTPVTTTLTAKLDAHILFSGKVTLGGKESRVFTTPDVSLDNLRLWSMEEPNLYTIEITTDTDDLLDRTGFRKVSTDGSRILLNGKPIELRGINRHEDHPDWGFAFPPQLMTRDLDIIENMNCNSIRASHYPNAPIFVDMLDERGITFWSEIPIWGHGYTEESLGDPIIVERGLQMHREMVKYYYNHPSILIWGMHNEIPIGNENAYKLTELYYNFLKSKGGDRLVTYATDRVGALDRICPCDIVSVNAYCGWYQDESWETFLAKVRNNLHSQGFGNVPVIMSEFGSAAIYGHHTFDDLKWTEEYQAELIANSLELFRKDPMIAGYYVWQYCDIRTSKEMGLNRARSFNNKGIVNEYRRPKAAYHTIRQLYHQFRVEEEV